MGRTPFPRLRLRVKPSVEGVIRSGHPWVFAESIREQNREGAPGELAIIYNHRDQFLAVGLFDPDSPLRIRIIHTGKPVQVDREWWRGTLQKAVARRGGVFNAGTNGGRLINGESDKFPGLVLDRYGDTLVLKIYSSIWRKRLDEIASLIQEEVQASRLVLRFSRNLADKIGVEEGSVLWGAALDSPMVHFLENGLRFEADVVHGQKTGFFLDQRENRRQVETLAKGKSVLNAFSFSGGFSLYAARGGAAAVTDVDISAHALESARRNFALNDHPAIRQCQHRQVQADVFEWLGKQRAGEYDLVIIDPPSLARREAERAGALEAYARLTTGGLRLTNKKGVLVCCSCSGHIRAEEFFSVVGDSLKRSGRSFEVLRQSTEPDDHHASFPEAQYLKAMFVALD